MQKIIKVFAPQPWHPQHDVSIHEDGKVSVDRIEVNTDREKALANIILRLNSQVAELQDEIKKSKNDA